MWSDDETAPERRDWRCIAELASQGMPLVPVIAMPVDANPHARWSGMLKILKKALKRLAFFLFLPRRKSHVPRTPFA